MKLSRIIICIAMSIIALNSFAYRPRTYNINGSDIVRKDGPYDNAGEFTDGVVLATPDEMTKASVYIKEIYEQDEYTILLLQIDYWKQGNTKRPSEWYFATYKKYEKGVIDAVFAGSEGDIAYADGKEIFPDSGYDFMPKKTECSAWRNSATVTREYFTRMGLRGADEDTENGTITWHYAVDRQGFFSLPADSVKQKAVNATSPNESVIGRKDDPTRNYGSHESDKCSTIGPGMIVFDLIMTPRSDKKLPQHFEDTYKYLDGDQLPQQESARLNKILTTWQQRLFYRDPSLWLEWAQQNPDSQVLKNIKAANEDSTFAAFFDEQINALDKKARKWWKKQLK